MSLTSKVFLATCSVAAVGIVIYVHYKQEYERNRLHQGVIRDIERQEQRKQENVYMLQQQLKLTEELKMLQNSKSDVS